MSDWVKFYDFKHSVIYVNARHRDVHYHRIAEDIGAYVPSPTAHVLDYGCGEATSADDGSFVIEDVEPGTYRATIPSSTFRPPWEGVNWLSERLASSSR